MKHRKIHTDVVVEAVVDVPVIDTDVPKEIQKSREREAEAVEDYDQEAHKALEIIKDNHFHLTLHRAIGGRG